MRALAQFDDDTRANRFSDVLLAENVLNSVEKTRDGKHTVWIFDESHLDKGKDLLAQFQEDPFSDAIKQRAERGSEIRKSLPPPPDPRKVAQSRAKEKSATARVVPRLSKPRVTQTLIVTCILIYVAIEFMGQDEVRAALLFAKNPIMAYKLGYGVIQALGGEYWRLFTPVLMHAPPGPTLFGLLHIVFNLWWLKDLGGILEGVHGSLKMVVVVLLAGVSSNIAQYLYGGPFFIGMSGVVYALFGYLWLRGKFDVRAPYQVPPRLVNMLLFWFGLCWLTEFQAVSGAVGFGVANMAHTAGLASGCAIGFVSARTK